MVFYITGLLQLVIATCGIGRDIDLSTLLCFANGEGNERFRP